MGRDSWPKQLGRAPPLLTKNMGRAKTKNKKTVESIVRPKIYSPAALWENLEKECNTNIQTRSKWAMRKKWKKKKWRWVLVYKFISSADWGATQGFKLCHCVKATLTKKIFQAA